MGFEFIFLCLLVILRYFFNTSIIGGQELIDYLFIYLSAFGSALLIGTDEHIAVNFFEHAPILVQRILQIVNYVALFLLQLFLGVLSLSWIEKIGSFPTPVLQWPQRIFQLAIPLSMGIGMIVCLFRLFSLIVSWKTSKMEVIK